MVDFLEKVTKDLEKSGIEVGASQPPSYWFSTGNYVLNKIISGSFKRGLPQGRMISFAGPAQAGKSFLICNAMREAQKEGASIVAIDTENALDDEFVSSIGVDIDNDYHYIEADTIAKTKKIVSAFINGYKKAHEGNDDAPKLFIAIDSLDMLMTETEEDNFDKGVSKGDMGQRNKQLKAMLREFVQNIKHLNITIATTSQVYRNQDITNGEGIWMISDAVRYAPSQIVLITKLKLKEGTDIQGIRMKCEAYKTRFTKPFQTVTIEVPYESGIDPYNGLDDVAVDLGIIEKKGAWKYYKDKKWNSKNIPEDIIDDILEECEKERVQYLEARINTSDLDLTEGVRPKAKRKARAESKKS
jgi:recombination protein RecA